MSGLDRREFLRAAAATSAGVVLGPAAWRAAYAAPAAPGPGPYGPLVGPDPHGLLLPAGFTARVIARSGEPVLGTALVWPRFPDGAAVFTLPGGGWLYAANSEVLGQGGGASAIRFRPDGTIADAYSILSGTTGNCSGGATPWGTWLSCEETHAASHVGEGLVWECDPTRPGQGVARPAMGRFNHEAVAVDPIGRRVYLTEDRADGRFYRFTPTAYPDLSTGLLEAAAVTPAGLATWVPVPDPAASASAIRSQVPQATAFNRGEGCWHDSGFVYFVTTGDNRVWVHDLAAQTFGVLYDARDHGNPPLIGVDSVLVSSAHDVYVAEDGGNMEIVVISRERQIAPVVRYLGNQISELTGLAFDPSGQRLYFSSQRGPAPSGPGITFEITGPFRQAAPPPRGLSTPSTAPATTAAAAAAASTPAPTAPPPTTSAMRRLQASSANGTSTPGSTSRSSATAAPLTFVAAGMTGSVWAALWRYRRARASRSERDPSVRPQPGPP
jgi:secreted PhoX family phosphatase